MSISSGQFTEKKMYRSVSIVISMLQGTSKLAVAWGMVCQFHPVMELISDSPQHVAADRILIPIRIEETHHSLGLLDRVAPPRLRSHPPLRLPRQPAAGYSPAPLLSITRPHTTTADRTSSIPRQARQSSLSLSQMRRDHGHQPDPHRRSDPAPFSAFVPPCRMKPISKNRKSRSVFRLDVLVRLAGERSFCP